jgi:HK97 family phage portal protein
MRLWPWSKIEKREADPSWAALVNQGALSDSGAFVDARSGESLSAVFACVQALSESVSTLPLHVYFREPNGDRTRADDHPLARVLREPNSYQSGLTFRESMTASVLLHGNGFARIETDAAGELVGLHPIDAPRVSLVRLPNNRHAFDYTDDDGRVRRLLQEEVFHLKDRTEPGSILGRSRITIARETLGLGLALRTHGARTFSNAARLSGVLQTPAMLSADQHQRLAASWREQYAGTSNAGRTAVLESGLEFKPLSMSLEDAQWIAASKFGVEEIARIFRVPPPLIQDLTHGTYTNVIELGAQFVRYSLARWIAMWESEVSRSLLGPIARRRYHAEHSVEGLLRGNPEARSAFYGAAIKDGWMTVDEVRKLENLPALDRAYDPPL